MILDRGLRADCSGAAWVSTGAGRKGMTVEETGSRDRFAEGVGVTARGPSVTGEVDGASLRKNSTARRMTRPTPAAIPILASLGTAGDSASGAFLVVLTPTRSC